MEHNTDRILWTVLVLAIGIALYVPFHASASSLVKQGVEKIQDVATNVNGNKSDSGTVDSSSDSDFSYSEPNTVDNTISIVGYSGHAEKLMIPQYRKIGSVSYKVTAIGNGAFQGHTSIKQVTIPDGVRTIGDSAFQLTPLTSVDLPAGLTSIGLATFAGTVLTSVDIPDSVTSIGDGAFVNTKLTSVDLPAGLTSIGEGAFIDTQLTSVDFPASLTSIGVAAFMNTPLTNVTFSDGLTSIGDSAFYNTHLTSADLPASLTSIGNHAFDPYHTVTPE